MCHYCMVFCEDGNKFQVLWHYELLAKDEKVLLLWWRGRWCGNHVLQRAHPSTPSHSTHGQERGGSGPPAHILALPTRQGQQGILNLPQGGGAAPVRGGCTLGRISRVSRCLRCLGCCNKDPWTRRLQPQTFISHRLEAVRSRIRELAVWFLVRAQVLACRRLSPCCDLTWQRERERKPS